MRAGAIFSATRFGPTRAVCSRIAVSLGASAEEKAVDHGVGTSAHAVVQHIAHPGLAGAEEHQGHLARAIRRKPNDQANRDPRNKTYATRQTRVAAPAPPVGYR